MANILRNDTDLLWLLKGNRRRIYQQIVSDTNKGVSGLATAKDVQQNARDLADLIEASGNVDATSTGALIHDMNINKVATADLDQTIANDFGLVWDDNQRQYYDVATATYYDTIIAKIQADAESISERYSRQTSITLQANINDLQQAITETNDLLNGEIRRGFIEVTEGGVQKRYFGIAITSRNIFTSTSKMLDENGNEVTDGGTQFYQIDTGECYGLYTATGWQFWVGNQKLGWFDTSDGQLHVNSINIESDFQMDKWLFHVDGARFGIKYIGG